MKFAFPYSTTALRPPIAGAFTGISLLLALVTLVPASVQAQGGGAVDPGFTPPAIGGNLDDDFNPAGSIQGALVQPDGKLVVVGSQIRGITRLNADGSRDTSFTVGAGADGTISAAVQQPDGSVLIGGDFTSINGVAAPRLARLKPDGTIDPVFKPQVAGGAVRALAMLPNGQVAVGGEFTQVAQLSARSLARLNADGSPDRTFNAAIGADGPVYALAAHPDGSGRLLVGGAFNSVGGAERANLGQVNADGSADLTFEPEVLPVTASRAITRSVTRTASKGTDGTVHAIKFLKDNSGRALIGGLFSRVGGSSQAALALVKPNGAADRTFQSGGGTTTSSATAPDEAVTHGISGGAGGKPAVYSLDLQKDGKILLGGLFDRTGSASRKNVARLNADGSADEKYNPGQGANASVRAVVVQPDEKGVIAGGFSAVDNVPRGGVARLLPGEADGGGNPGNALPVMSVVGAPARGGFVVSRPQEGAASALTVLYHNGGSAIRDGDYVAFPGRLSFGAGQGEAVIPVTLLPGANRQKKTKVFLDAAPNGEYGIGKAQSKVFLSDLP